MEEIIGVLYLKAKKYNPEFNESVFLQRVIDDWLEPYKLDKAKPLLTKNNSVLRNNLKQAIKISGKTQSQVALDIGIDRTYLTQIIKGKYEPSIKIVLLIAESINYPIEKIKDLFYLEPIEV